MPIDAIAALGTPAHVAARILAETPGLTLADLTKRLEAEGYGGGHTPYTERILTALIAADVVRQDGVKFSVLKALAKDATS